MIDASAIASVTGVDVQYVQASGGVGANLPQRIAVFAQAQTGFVFPAAKKQLTSAAPAGALYGYKSPIYLALRELFPTNGDGVGTIPVTVYPMSDAAGAVAATGDITPSGTASDAGQYNLRIGGVLSAPFVIPKGAVNVNLTLAAIGTALSSVLQLPALVSYAYGSPTSTAGASNHGTGTLTAPSVTGSPLPGNWSLVCNTAVANGGVFTLTDPNGSVVSTTVTMTPSAGGATVINVGGLQFTLTDASTDFSVGDSFTITVPATKANLTVPWKGTSGNSIKIEVIGPSLGVVFAVTQFAGGLVDPDPTPLLGLIGNTWETLLLNGLPVANTTALDAYKTFGDGRWHQTVRKPCVVFTGSVDTTVAAASAVSSQRTTDRINSLLSAPGSPNLPIVVAARQLARIAVVANNNPPTDYNAQSCEDLIPGDDSVQWDWPTRDQANKAGVSTIAVVDGVIQIRDVVTFYAPTGEVPPAYRDVVDIVKLMNITYRMGLIFSAKEWAAAPLIQDGQPTVNPNARKPSDAKSELFALSDDLSNEAIITNTAASKKGITAVVSAPKRLDIGMPVFLSGNTKIKSTTLYWSFFVG